MKAWEFLISVGEYKQATGQRMGQAMFNIAATTWKGLGEKVLTNDYDAASIDRIDPFYNDARIPAFLKFLKSEGYIED